ncbi:CopD family protein [Streptomyces sp. NPDC060194]|uniref:CopD family protein n=1 Tax=Streptomyces sp. NPDC060194 TaxID=3347069 RepID=UPI003665662F
MPAPVDAGIRAPRRSTTARWAAVAAFALVLLAGGTFGVSLATRGTGELHIPEAGVATLLRTVVFAAFGVLLGEQIGTRHARAAVPDLPAPRPWSRAAALVGAAATAGLLLRLGAVNGLGMSAAYDMREGRLLLVTANAFVLTALLHRSRWALLPLAAAVVAEAMRAHPEPYAPEIGVALTVVHLTAASLWCGGLLYVLRATHLNRRFPASVRPLLARYARVAVWLLAALAATGTLSTLRRLPPDVILTSGYGRTLILKLALVGVVCVLALAARFRLHRAPADSRTTARTELFALGAVALVSAVLTVVPDPTWLTPLVPGPDWLTGG